jgi:hypothetical protein
MMKAQSIILRLNARMVHLHEKKVKAFVDFEEPLGVRDILSKPRSGLKDSLLPNLEYGFIDIES